MWITVEQANAFLVNIDHAGWMAASDDEKTHFIQRASNRLDTLVFLDEDDSRADSKYTDGSGIPYRLTIAVCHLALHYMDFPSTVVAEQDISAIEPIDPQVADLPPIVQNAVYPFLRSAPINAAAVEARDRAVLALSELSNEGVREKARGIEYVRDFNPDMEDMPAVPWAVRAIGYSNNMLVTADDLREGAFYNYPEENYIWPANPGINGRFVWVAQNADAEDILYIDPRGQSFNQIGGFTKQNSVVEVAGIDYAIWVSNAAQNVARYVGETVVVRQEV